MARFDVYRGDKRYGYLLDCQADLLKHLGSRVVVPLIADKQPPKASRLNPVFTVEGTSVVMATQLIFAIPAERLGSSIDSLDAYHSTIMNALDMLLTGY